jgi:hypothetical protein
MAPSSRSSAHPLATAVALSFLASGALAASPEVGPGDTPRLSRLPDAGFTMATEPPIRPLYDGEPVRVGATCGGYLLVQRGRGTAMRGLIVGLASGQIVGEVPEPRYPKCIDGWLLVGSQVGEPGAFDTRSGSLHRVALPTDVLPPELRVAAFLQPVHRDDGKVVEILVDVHGPHTGQHVGIWRPGDPTLELQPADFGYVERIREAGGKVQVETYRVLHELSAERTRALHEGNARRYWLHGGLTAVAEFGSPFLIDAAGKRTPVPLGACDRPELIAAYAPAQATLTLCVDPDDPAADVFLYQTPGRTFRFAVPRPHPVDAPDGKPDVHDGRPVVAQLNAPLDVAAGRWFDLSTGALWQGSAWRPLEHGRGDSEPRRLYATTHSRADPAGDRPIELAIVDLNEGIEQLLVRYDDCPGFLASPGERVDAVIVQCVEQPEPGRWHFVHRWSELVDLRAATRWRTTSYELHGFTEDGRVIATDRDAGGTAGGATRAIGVVGPAPGM